MNKPSLFAPLKIGSIEIKNRIVVSPMCMYSSTDGFSNEWHLVHLGSRAVGGAGLIISEATAISPEGRISPYDLGIWKDEHILGLQQITSFLKGQGSVPGIQLAHAGRKASTSTPWTGGNLITPEEGGWQPLAPSAIPFFKRHPSPVELDKAGLKKVRNDFRLAAQRALQAGFKVAEIHAAHGYLLHEFLSPLSNSRSDAYGGSFENRIRLLLEVIQEVRSVWPENLPLFVRISVTDWMEGGWGEDESVALAQKLEGEGVNLVDCSSGGIVPQAQIPVQKGYQVRFAKRIKKETGMMTGAVGLIKEAEEAEKIISQEQADLVFIGRQSLRDPYFPLQAAEVLEADISWPRQYERARSRG